MEWQKSEFIISDDSDKLNVDWIVSSLRQTYWGCNRAEEVITSSFHKSLCFGLYCGERQIGFARVVTDDFTFAWLCDVFIDEKYRGQGLGTWLVATVLEHPVLQRIGLKILGTQDAHGLYEKFGFAPAMQRFMVKKGS